MPLLMPKTTRMILNI